MENVKDMMKVVVTIPTFNEGKYISGTILEIREVMSGSGYTYMIHVQDDCSTDGTYEIVKGIAESVDKNPMHLGLAGTFRGELENSLKLDADIIVHIDADGQYSPETLPQLIRKVEEDFDLVIGSRFRGGMRYKGPLTRRVGNILLSKAVSLLTSSECTDVTSGCRAFNRKTATVLRLRTTMTYTYEQYILARMGGLSTVEVPIEVKQTRPSRLIKNMFVYAIRAAVDILMIIFWRVKP